MFVPLLALMMVVAFFRRRIVDVIVVNFIGVASGSIAWACAINAFDIEATFDGYATFVVVTTAGTLVMWLLAGRYLR